MCCQRREWGPEGRRIEGTEVVDEKVLEEIQFHQDVINKDADSPLFQIREKEIEISGRVLAAKTKAEAVVAEARKKAADIVGKADDEGERLAREHEAKALAEAEGEADKIRAGVGTDVEAIRATISSRSSDAVSLVVGMIKGS
jgi:vacuolar-type H+-ATPase subunit H